MQVVALFQDFSGGGRDLIPTFGDFAARYAANARFVAVDTSLMQVTSLLAASPARPYTRYSTGDKLVCTARRLLLMCTCGDVMNRLSVKRG